MRFLSYPKTPLTDVRGSEIQRYRAATVMDRFFVPFKAVTWAAASSAGWTAKPCAASRVEHQSEVLPGAQVPTDTRDGDPWCSKLRDLPLSFHRAARTKL